MKRFVFPFAFLMLFAAAPAWAQRGAPERTPPAMVPAIATPPAVAQPTIPTATGELRATPEMWFYEQYVREYKDPKNAVRANAEFTAKQRANRLAAMRWFGLSNSRPRVGADPVNVYPPAWVSNTPLQPNRWQATGGQPYYLARPDQSGYRSY
ncbi:MAG: hypothetical protein IT426_01140 [Pirellulales bacterium]|nr:hypothetical protein [Pirellulales bacterium]